MGTKTQRSSKASRQVRDAEATQKQILDAAMAEFAKHGLSGARIEAIAKGASVTTAMIYYYFESKEGLYQAVLQRLASDINDWMPQLDLDSLPPESALKQLMQGYIAYEAKNPYFGKILWQEAIQNQGRYYKQTNWQEGFKEAITILQRGMTEGCFRPLDPFITAIHIAGICSFYFDAYENLKYLVPDLDLLSPEMIEKHTQEAINLILAGVLSKQV